MQRSVAGTILFFALLVLGLPTCDPTYAQENTPATPATVSWEFANGEFQIAVPSAAWTKSANQGMNIFDVSMNIGFLPAGVDTPYHLELEFPIENTFSLTSVKTSCGCFAADAKLDQENTRRILVDGKFGALPRHTVARRSISIRGAVDEIPYELRIHTESRPVEKVEPIVEVVNWQVSGELSDTVEAIVPLRSFFHEVEDLHVSISMTDCETELRSTSKDAQGSQQSWQYIVRRKRPTGPSIDLDGLHSLAIQYRIGGSVEQHRATVAFRDMPAIRLRIAEPNDGKPADPIHLTAVFGKQLRTFKDLSARLRVEVGTRTENGVEWRDVNFNVLTENIYFCKVEFPWQEDSIRNVDVVRVSIEGTDFFSIEELN